MILVKKVKDLRQILNGYRSRGLSVGFVPTMGALHAGHISLIKTCKGHHDITVCSVFINPAQFNNAADFEKYPIKIEKDIEMLDAADCNLLFLPAVGEMYPEADPVIVYELGYIENMLEGTYRPGHFQGVCRIVDKLLAAVLPDTLYLGQKDYQQCMVIARLISLKQFSTQLFICPIVREADGLAMSSRNMRLDETERRNAGHIYRSLQRLKETIKPGETDSFKITAFNYLQTHGFKVDYVEIVAASSLEPVINWDGTQQLVVLVAAHLNEVRLIDNLYLN